LEYALSEAGDIDFMGVYTDTNEKVRGTVPDGATEVTILSVEGLDLAQVVTFTRIN